MGPEVMTLFLSPLTFSNHWEKIKRLIHVLFLFYYCVSPLLMPLTSPQVKFVFPSAPLSLAAQGMGLAWYPLDINRMVMRAMSGEVR